MILESADRSASENMALDNWLLSQISENQPLSFRSYGWTGSCFTFGYTQRYQDVLRHPYLQNAGPLTLCRRPTAGGIVDHRNDWTYALAIEASTTLSRSSPLELYRGLHQCLADALNLLGIEACLYEPKDSELSPTACFERPSPYDVIDPSRGEKIAGAALKRCKQGVLVQGSLSRDMVKSPLNEGLEEQFAAQLIHFVNPELSVVRDAVPEHIPMLEQFASLSWLEKR